MIIDLSMILSSNFCPVENKAGKECNVPFIAQCAKGGNQCSAVVGWRRCVFVASSFFNLSPPDSSPEPERVGEPAAERPLSHFTVLSLSLFPSLAARSGSPAISKLNGTIHLSLVYV